MIPLRFPAGIKCLLYPPIICISHMGKKKNKTHPTKKENYTTEKYQVRIDYKSPCRSQITYSKKLELLIRKEAK